MRRVILESPYAGQSRWRLVALVQRYLNRRYARACVRHALTLGDAPIASHLLYTQRGILRDGVDAERRWGIGAGLAWLEVAEATVVYVDRGISSGMEYGVQAARGFGRPVEFRELKPGRLARTAAFAQHLRDGKGGDMRVDVAESELPRAWPGHGPADLTPAIPAKQGRNIGPSQVTKRPTPPAPMVPRRCVPRFITERVCDCYIGAADPRPRVCTCIRDGAPTNAPWHKAPAPTIPLPMCKWRPAERQTDCRLERSLCCIYGGRGR